MHGISNGAWMKTMWNVSMELLVCMSMAITDSKFCKLYAFTVHEDGDNQLKIPHIILINLDNERVA